jgi:hypothetical protein
MSIKISPWEGVLERQTVERLVEKFPVFYGNRRAINVFKIACHWTLS